MHPHTCSKTRLACGWRPPKKVGVGVRTWTQMPRAPSEHPSVPVLASSRISAWKGPRQVAALAPGSTLAMTFLLPLELADPEVRPALRLAEKGARASGTPFISFFTPTEMLTMAREAGFTEVQHVSAATLAQRYFAGRTDGLRPPSNSEELLVATT